MPSPKSQKEFLRISMRILNDSNDRVLFKVLSAGVLFWILSDKVFLGSSGIVFYLGALVIESS